MTTPAALVKEMFGQDLPSLATTPMETDRPRRHNPDDRRPKWQKPDGKGSGYRPDKRIREDKDNDSQNWFTNAEDYQLTDQISGEEVRRLLAILTRLCLRQEDDIAATRADSAFLFYMETKPDPELASSPYQPFANNFYAVAQRWQQIKENTPQKLDLSLRSTLLLAYMTEFHERLSHAIEPKNKEICVKAGWMQETTNATPCWTYAKWDSEKKVSIVDTSKTPVAHSKILDAVAHSLKLLGDSSLIHRFRATRPLAETYESNILTFLMLVSNRGQEAENLFSTMALLTDCNATQLMRTRFAKERLRRQPLAQVLQREAYNLLRATNPHSSNSGEIAEKADDCFGAQVLRANLSTYQACSTGLAF
ncbi:unnamed protein product [Symbiodinium sp. CCMP2592]|nr:unnamed protein product [Symbiodinium sp. CCMP2592]